MVNGQRLAELAEISGSELEGAGGRLISGAATLQTATENHISFLANPRYRRFLQTTRAGAVVVRPQEASLFAGDKLIHTNPYLAFARIAAFLHPRRRPDPGIHPSAVVQPDAVIGAGVVIGAQSYVGAAVEFGEGVIVGIGVVLEAGCRIGKDTVLEANVAVGRDVRIGERCLIHHGAVIGSDGFGLAQEGDRWEKFPQLGSVVLGDDVEVGANTTIDRGALDDTRISRGVKLDNQIQIAHNVVIGEDTAIAACVGISGSTEIGARCTIAGGVGFVGHLTIADDVHVTGMSMVTTSLTEPGVYSGIPAEKNRSWRKNIARFHQLDELARRLITMEKSHDRKSR